MAATSDTRAFDSPERARARARTRPGWGVLLLGWICVLFGLVILTGGVWLIALGGSWYYGLAGAGLIATGILLNHASMNALWLYLVIWIATLGWAWWEVGTDWWAQVPRLIAPTVILVLLLCCIPNVKKTARLRHSD